MNIEELSTSLSEGREIRPSEGSWKKVRSRYMRQHFLRFDPGSFNVYYLGSLLIAGAVLTGLLIKGDSGQAVNQRIQESVEHELSADPALESGASRAKGEEVQPLPQGKEGEEGKKDDRSVVAGNDLKKDERLDEGQVDEPGSESYAERESKPGVDPQVEQVEAASVPAHLISYFTASVTIGCAPLEVSFLNASSEGVKYSWSFGNEGRSTQKDPVHLFSAPGRYTVILRVQDEQGMSAFHRQIIEVQPGPEASFEILKGLEGEEGCESLELINYSSGAAEYSWTLVNVEGEALDGWESGKVQPELFCRDIPEEAHEVRLLVASAQSCMDTALVEIPDIPKARSMELYFPTAFEASHTGPGGGYYSQYEKRSDIFYPVYTTAPAEYHLQVFSRLGELVFETRDIYFGWDGYMQQRRAAGGVYLWVCEGRWEDGTSFAMRGDLTLFWSDSRWP